MNFIISRLILKQGLQANIKTMHFKLVLARSLGLNSFSLVLAYKLLSIGRGRSTYLKDCSGPQVCEIGDWKISRRPSVKISQPPHEAQSAEGGD